MIFTIFKKELKETLRDRRTLLMMIVIPVLIIPVILNISVGIMSNVEKEAAAKELRIGIVGKKDAYIAKEISSVPAALGKKKILFYPNVAALNADLKKDSLDLGILSDPSLEEKLKAKIPASIVWYFDGSEMGMQERAQAYMQFLETKMEQQRLAELNINPAQIKPLVAVYQNVASDKEMIGKLAGGFLPYIFIAFGFMGCMYPAIDLFTGEKERGTIETMLVVPVARWKILFGKMGVVILSGLLASTFSLLGLYFSINYTDTINVPEITNVIQSILTFKFILILFLLLIPLTVFFAGVLITLAIYAKYFKEAQSIITPLNLVMILPAMLVSFIPTFELTYATACIPIINIVLASKDLIAGTLDYGMLAVSFLVMTVFAASSVFLSNYRFGKESNVSS
jgi:sodium transport system permease protein